MDKEVVKELIQNDFTKKNLKLELDKIIAGETREELLVNYNLLEHKLGGAGASMKTAKMIYELNK